MTVDARSLRRLPKVGDVLESETGRALLGLAPRWAVLAAVRAEVARLREGLKDLAESGDGQSGDGAVVLDAARLAADVARRARPSLQRVINATGVVLHTNLGRAPLAEAAISRVLEVARGYSNLEYQLDERRRGTRHDHVVGPLCELCGSEAALVVNNCAGAVLVALATLAAGGQVVVSRGELIEIGGGFRVPEVMTASGASLVEVGTTNRTRIADYERALDGGGDIRLLMRVHRSNFALVGFTEEPTVAELVALGQARGLPLFVDLGGGALAPIPGLPVLPEGAAGPEPIVRELITAGADLVAFSGDKLLGGPQAGILVGKRALIDRILRHPLMRALRPDKLTLAALEGTLSLHRADRSAEIPSIAMMTCSEPALHARALRLVALLTAERPDGAFESVRARSAIGGGALPTVEPWSWAVSVALPAHSEVSLEEALRAAEPPVIGRISDGRLLLDVRTLREPELAEVARAISSVATSAQLRRSTGSEKTGG